MTMHDPYHDGQGDTADLVRSLALSSAKLWEELFDRLRRIELAQSELRELVAKIEVALPSASSSPELERGAGALPAAGLASTFEEALSGGPYAALGDSGVEPSSESLGASGSLVAMGDLPSGTAEGELTSGFSWQVHDPEEQTDWTAPPPIWTADDVVFDLAEVPPPPPTVTFEGPVSSVTFEAPVSTAAFGLTAPGPSPLAPLAPSAPSERFAAPPPPPPAGFVPTPPTAYGFAPAAPPPPLGFAPMPPPPVGFAPVPPPPVGLVPTAPTSPPEGFTLSAAPPSDGFVSLPPAPPEGFAAAPPPPLGYSIVGSPSQAAPVANDVAGHPMVAEDTVQVPTVEGPPASAPASARAEPQSPPPLITPDFFARAGRRRP